LLFEPVGVSEGDFGQRSASPAVVYNLFHHSFNVPVAFREIQVPELRFVQPVVVVGFEDTFRVSTSLVTDYTTHFSIY
jgi:hypothetical protein